MPTEFEALLLVLLGIALILLGLWVYERLRKKPWIYTYKNLHKIVRGGR